MMLEPAMRNLRETWMGAYYLKELSKRSRTIELNVQAEAITDRISIQYKKLETLKKVASVELSKSQESEEQET